MNALKMQETFDLDELKTGGLLLIEHSQFGLMIGILHIVEPFKLQVATWDPADAFSLAPFSQGTLKSFRIIIKIRQVKSEEILITPISIEELANQYLGQKDSSSAS